MINTSLSLLFLLSRTQAENSDLMAYKNLQHFFGRPLKASARIVDVTAPLVSPADSRVLYYGEVSENSLVEQVRRVLIGWGFGCLVT